MKPNCWVDEKFPYPLETEEQNYWLGLLMADGSLTMAGTQANLRLELQRSDGYLVRAFARYIDSKDHETDRPSVVTSKKCTREAGLWVRHGICPHKSGKESWPTSVTRPWAFLRGVFDGDGTVRRVGRYLSFCIYSYSDVVLEPVSWLLQDVLGLTAKVQLVKGMFRVTANLGWQKANLLYICLYRDADHFLHRKEEVIREFVSRPRPLKGNPDHRKGIVKTRGERNGAAKITEDMVRAIRQAYVPRKVTYDMLGARFGLCREAIRKIVLRRTWADVSD